MRYFSSNLSATYCSDLDLIGGLNRGVQIPVQLTAPMWSTYTEVGIRATHPALQRCHGVNLVGHYTWNYQLTDTVIWLSAVNRAGVGWGPSSDGDLQRADYFSIIHSRQNIIAYQKTAIDPIRLRGTRTTPSASRLQQPAVRGRTSRLLRAPEGHAWCEAAWPQSEFTAPAVQVRNRLHLAPKLRLIKLLGIQYLTQTSLVCWKYGQTADDKMI